MSLWAIGYRLCLKNYKVIYYYSQYNEIMIEVTDRCNLDCRFCFNKLYVERKDKENIVNILSGSTIL